MPKEDRGLIHIYYGNGKGKTTCSVGLTVRAAGSGRKVLFVQFMKTGKSSEVAAIEGLPGVTVIDAPRMTKFSFSMTDEEVEEMRKANDKVLSEIKEMIKDDGYDLLVMDETLGSCHKGFMDEAMLLDLLKTRPERLEVVMTGRHPDDTLLEMADYVTEMHKVKHPFDKGINAREGIEY